MSMSEAYVAATERAVALLGGSHPLAHVHAGLAVYVAAQVILRDRRASLHGLIAVLGAELANEVVEAAFYRSFRWADTAGDVALTLFWPAILYVAGRYRRRRWTAARDRARDAALLLAAGAGPVPGR